MSRNQPAEEAVSPDAFDASLFGDAISGNLLIRSKPEFTAVHDSNSPNLKKAIYDEETNTVTLYLPDGWEVLELHEEAIMGGIDRGARVFSVNEIASIEIDSASQRTCKWFTADQGEFVDSEVETSPAFRFYKPLNACSCSQPDVVKRNPSTNAGCDFPAAMINCPIYEAQEWEVVKIVKGTLNNGTEQEVTLSKTRRGYGEPVYQETCEDETIDSTPAQFEDHLSKFDMKEDVPLSDTKPRNSFLAFVIGEKVDAPSS